MRHDEYRRVRWARPGRAGSQGRRQGRGAARPGAGSDSGHRRADRRGRLCAGRPGPPGDRRRAARGPVHRRPLPDQGPRLRGRRLPDVHGLAPLPRLPVLGRLRAVHPAGTRRAGHVRPHHQPGVRHRTDGRSKRVRATDPQSVEPRPRRRWLVGGFGSRRRRRGRADRPRQRRRWIGAHPRLVVRPVRPQTDTRSAAGWPDRRRGLGGHGDRRLS